MVTETDDVEAETETEVDELEPPPSFAPFAFTATTTLSTVPFSPELDVVSVPLTAVVVAEEVNVDESATETGK